MNGETTGLECQVEIQAWRHYHQAAQRLATHTHPRFLGWRMTYVSFAGLLARTVDHGGLCGLTLTSSSVVA